MGRLAMRRARPLPIRRQPDGMGFGERTSSEDPRGPGRRGTLPYREATELLRCIEIMGPGNDAYCRDEVLGGRVPRQGLGTGTAANPPAPEFRDVAGISSPVPFHANVAADGSASTVINGVPARIAPDANSTDTAMANRAETRADVSLSGVTWQTSGGRVTSLTPPTATVTIRTTYGPGASPNVPSGYGRGTTAADTAAGTTTLGFHEGRHGVDQLRYLAANPPPVFTGAVGMTVAQVQAANTAYQAAWAAYIAEMGHQSVHGTDCVGSTAAAPLSVTTICGHTHP